MRCAKATGAPSASGGPGDTAADLRTYRAKRDFEKTPEPAGRQPTSSKFPIYVIQEHDATAHHYDVRFEIDGVLKSWSVPKGPSLDPSIKRLAIRTEDHPLEYADFEGLIPEGEYGGGPVIIWDRGVFQNLSPKPLTLGMEHGHLSLWLEGLKLRGGFSLTRIREVDGKEHWILAKQKDEAADPDVDLVGTRPESVMSGHTIATVGTKGRVWRSNRGRSDARPHGS